ncbi:hypothetical protein K438DRAFT_133367 [Mycena galopus ATCC 62051]|nr:hypothetical protein K438DRAFT_133367 [Mycena galopus ATCC 62051]
MRSVNTTPLAACSTHPALRTSRLTPCPQHQAPVHPRYDTQQAQWFFNACAARRSDDLQRNPPQPSMFSVRACMLHSWDVQHQCRARRPLRPFPTVFLASRPQRLCPSLPRLSFPRSPKYHAQRSRGCSSSAAPRPCTPTISVSPSASLVYHRRRSTPTRPTPCLRTLGARRAAPPACARRRPHLNHQEALVAHSHRPPRRNYLQVRRGAPATAGLAPRQSQPRWSMTRTIRRDNQGRQLAGDRLQHYHTARDSPRDSTPATRRTRCTARLGRHLLRAVVLRCCPTPTRSTPRLRAPQPRPSLPAARAARGARVCRPSRRFRSVPMQRDRLDQCIALTARRPCLPRSSVSPTTRPASAPPATVVPHR